MQARIEFGISSLCSYKPPPMTLKNVDYKAEKLRGLIRRESDEAFNYLQKGEVPDLSEQQERVGIEIEGEK